MKIPKEIKGNNRLRDLDICRLYIEGKKPIEIKELRNLPITVRAIQKVVSNNSAFVNPRVAWPKTKRIMRLQRLANIYEGIAGKGRGELDILAELRKEIEGEKALVDLSKHEHITVVLDSSANIQAQQAADGVLVRD